MTPAGTHTWSTIHTEVQYTTMSQGNPKGSLLEKQAGCVHSDKHAHSPCWRKFHPRIWSGYQTLCCRRLQCIHGVCGQVRQNGQQLWNCLQNMEVDQKTIFSPNRHDHSQRISNTQVVWWQNDAQKVPWNTRWRIDYSQEENVTASGISRGRPSATASQLSWLGLCILGSFETWHTRVDLLH